MALADNDCTKQLGLGSANNWSGEWYAQNLPSVRLPETVVLDIGTLAPMARPLTTRQLKKAFGLNSCKTNFGCQYLAER